MSTYSVLLTDAQRDLLTHLVVAEHARSLSRADRAETSPHLREQYLKRADALNEIGFELNERAKEV